MTELELLKLEFDRAEASSRDARIKLEQFHVDQMKSILDAKGIKVGDKVRLIGRDEKFGIVAGIRASVLSAWPHLKKIKKDGTASIHTIWFSSIDAIEAITND
jgi:hypothetical protein